MPRRIPRFYSGVLDSGPLPESGIRTGESDFRTRSGRGIGSAMSENKPVNIQIQADDSVKDGAYCNMAMIAHSPEEFVMDFIFVVPNPPYGKLRSRIVMSASHAKRFMRAMQENVVRYEQQFGTINEMPPPGGGNVVN